MATFIDAESEQDQLLELARFVNKLKTKGKDASETFTEESTKLVQSGQIIELLLKLVDESSLLFSDASDKEVDGFFFVIASNGKKLGGDSLGRLVTRIIERVTSNPEDKAQLRIRVLNNLYNVVGSNGQIRYQIYQDLVKFAIASRNSELILNQLKESNLDAKMAEWSLNPKQKRELLKQIRDLFANSKSTRSFKWNIKYLTSLEMDGSDEEKRASLDEAVKIIVEAIRSTEFIPFDSILRTPIVSKLDSESASTQQRSAFQLLRIFANENHDSYQKFIRSSSFDVSSIGLNSEDTLRKIRLLSLATLGNSALNSTGTTGSEIPYSLIAKTLEVDESEVESWVISAISEELLVAKMDQLRRVVIVSRALQRVFSDSQWKQIGDSIQTWRKNVKVMLNTLQETKKLNLSQQHAAFTKAIQQNS